MDGDDDDDFNFDEFPDENSSPVKKNNASKDEDRESLRQGLRDFSQRSQGRAAQCEDDGEEIESRNDFEKTMKEDHGIELRRDEDGKEYFYLSRHMNHLSFVNHLNAVLTKEKAEKLMGIFRRSIDGRLILFLYFAPMKSRSGEQDTLWRAFLLSKETQNTAFDHLMEQMQKLAKDDSKESSDLALVAVSHTRIIDRVFDITHIYESVFERDFENWNPIVRDTFIQAAVPEIFGDIMSQNKAAVDLVIMLTERTVKEEPNDFKLAIIEALKLLNTGKAEATEIRSKLIVRMSSMEARTAVEVIKMVMDGLDTNDQSSLHEVLVLFSKHFKLTFHPTLGTKNKKIKDDVAIAIGTKIGRFIQLSGAKCWRNIGPFFRSLVSDADKSENGEEDSQPIREWRIFDIILCLSLMSLEGCPSSIGTALKSQITDDMREEDVLEEKFRKVFEMNKFCLHYFTSLLRLSRSLLWSPLDSLNHFSTFIYSSLLRSLEKKRKDTLSSMLSHLDKSEREAAAVLDCISSIIKREYGIIKDHINIIHESFLSLLPSLSVASARKMITVVISICTKDPTQEALKIDIEGTSRRLLSSISSRDQSLGIVCMVMQLRNLLDNQNDSDREEQISNVLDDLAASTKGSSLLRWTFYDEVRLMLEKSSKWKISNKFMEWADALEETFKKEFFHHRIDDQTHSQSLEASKYVNENSDQWLQVSHERLVELVPLFGLLKELSMLKCRWTSDDETQEVVRNSFDQFLYTFEANITMCGAGSVFTVEKDELLVNSTIFFHLIQWIRNLLNSFCAREESDDSSLSKLKNMKFSLLFDMEKSLIQTIKQLREVRVPSSIVKELNVVIYDENAKKTAKKRVGSKKSSKKGRKKKKKNGDGEDEIEEEEEEREEERVDEEEENENRDNGDSKDGIKDERAIRIPLSSLHTVFTPFKMSTVVQLMKLQVGKRIRSVYLLDNLLKIVKITLPKKEKKAVPWMPRRSPLDVPSIEYHGDTSSIWKYTLSAISPIVHQLIAATTYFKELDDSQSIADSVDVNNSMAAMLNKTISLLMEIFTSKDVVNSVEDETEKRRNKRINLMEAVEKKILNGTSSQRESENDDAETTVLKFLLGVAKNVPTIDCAVAVMECCYSIEGRDEDANTCLGQWCLKYLQREWTSDGGKTQKGTIFKNSVRRLFELYLSYRNQDDRPKAILWILAEQLTTLVGDAEKRKSKMDCVASPVDDYVPRELIGQKFATLNKETFPVVYKAIFSTLNTTLQSFMNTRHEMSTEDILTLWTKSCSAFCLLCLLLRVTSLRSNGVLMTAVKEGRRFLGLVVKPTGFMYLLEDETTFSLITNKVLALIKSVQTGNRALQNITGYAKLTRNASLLRSIPDLRASGEGWLRSIHTALTFLGCEEAFEIGLLKGRNIDGDEILEENDREETPMSKDNREEEEEEGMIEDEDGDERESSVENSADDMKEENDREGSPAY